MKYIKLSILAISLLFSSASIGQELAYGYYNYIMNRYNMNPAFAGNKDNISAFLNTKTYLSGFTNAPRNTVFGVHSPINEKQGLGLRVLSDKRGAYDVSKYDVTYSYEIKIDEESELRFGISAGALRRMLNPSNISNGELLNQTDPTLAQGYYDETNFVSGVGLLYQHKSLQVGLSSPHLIIGAEELSEHIVGTIAYNYVLPNEKFMVSPTVIYQSMPVIDNRYDILLKGEYQEKVWLQVGYQSTQNMNLGLGMDFGYFGIGYSYEMNNSDLSAISGGSNEIIITMGFEAKKRKKKDETLSTLDSYVAQLNEMIRDSGNKFNRSQVMEEIGRIRSELNSLEGENNKRQAKAVKSRLTTIENQIIELEKKYKK